MAQPLESVVAGVSNIWAEVALVCAFAVGFGVIRTARMKVAVPKRSKSANSDAAQEASTMLSKSIEAEVAAGKTKAALVCWRAAQAHTATTQDTLKIVAQAFVELEPDALVPEIVDHMITHPELATTSNASCILNVIAMAGRVDKMEELLAALTEQLCMHPTPHMTEAVLGGYAFAAQEDQVRQLLAQCEAERQRVTVRGYSLVIRGFLRNKMVEPSLKYAKEMLRVGYALPPFAISEIFKIACEADRAAEVLDKASPEIVLTSEAVEVLLEHALWRRGADFGRRVEAVAEQAGVPLTLRGFDALLKLYATAGHPRASALFRGMQQTNALISEGLCVGLLARSAEAKSLRFAEEVFRYAKDNLGVSISLYSALMKVYAFSGLHNRACDLYVDILGDGLVPDQMMYNCLMKFAAQCGRADMVQELAGKLPSLDIRNCMSLIRAAGNNKDPARALGILQQLEDAGVEPDIVACNRVLDVCASAGDVDGAQKLIDQMRAKGQLDIITYNTVLKGFCCRGDISGAKKYLAQMQSDGFAPNDISFNLVLNMIVSHGKAPDAWEMITTMKSNGVPPDCYTISTMMKVAKKSNCAHEVQRVLALMDDAGVDVCSDEVLLSTVTEACVRHRDRVRLDAILTKWEASGLKPGANTFGMLIRACSALKRIDRCRELWKELVEMRGLDPNEVVLGCMLDALVTHGQVDEALALFREWKGQVPPNAVMYSTLLKGFAVSAGGKGALALLKEMREEGISLTTGLYNSLVDVQARQGSIEEVQALVELMYKDNCQPDSFTSSLIIKAYCVRGDLDRALEAFSATRGDGADALSCSDTVVYNTLLSGCVRHNRMDLADDLLNNMKTYRIMPTAFTLGIIVKMWGRRHCLKKAFEAVEEFPKKYGFSTNNAVMTCLMSACVLNDDIEKAFEVFAKAKAIGDGVDSRGYGCLVTGCTRAGRLEDAVHLLEEAASLNQLSSDMLEQVVLALAKYGWAKTTGASLLKRLQTRGVPIPRRLTSLCS